MVIKELVILALLGLSVANDTTVSLFLPGAERQRLVGSIVASVWSLQLRILTRLSNIIYEGCHSYNLCYSVYG